MDITALGACRLKQEQLEPVIQDYILEPFLCSGRKNVNCLILLNNSYYARPCQALIKASIQHLLQIHLINRICFLTSDK